VKNCLKTKQFKSTAVNQYLAVGLCYLQPTISNPTQDATLLTSFSLWFRITNRHLMTSDHALMTNFCSTKLLISTNVTLLLACFTEIAI